MECVAEALIDAEAVQIRPQDPFQLASGRRSPVYVDVRRLLAFPGPRRKVVQGLVQAARDEIGLASFNVVAGGETAGIPFASFVALELERPLIYVRKTPKAHGRGQQIEGHIGDDGDRVLLVEDLVTDGGSKVAFQDGILDAGADVRHCLCVFEYASNRAGLREARSRLRERGLDLISLTNWDELMDALQRRGQLTPADHEAVLAFLQDPDDYRPPRG
ncbi:MAG: orotate phosphoribosyltransferase [Candidatus Bipolaricaulia bacterium]